MLQVQQLVDQRFCILGPLVQKDNSLNCFSGKHMLAIYRLKKIGTVLFLNVLNPTHVVSILPFLAGTDFILKRLLLHHEVMRAQLRCASKATQSKKTCFYAYL